MFRALQVAAVAATGLAHLNGMAIDTAVSREAASFGESWRALARHEQLSDTLYGPIARMNSELFEAAKLSISDADHTRPNPVALERARRLIAVLPVKEDLPRISIEDDGHVRFDWLVSSQKMFSLVVGPGTQISYAILCDNESHFGVIAFNGTRLPLHVGVALKGLWT
jgi:hypothetical protein